MIPRQNGVISPVILRQFIECPAWQWDPQVAQALRKTAHIRPWLTARCAWPIPFLVGGMLAHELAVLCAPEIAFALEVIDTGGDVDPDDPIAWARHTGRRRVRLPRGAGGKRLVHMNSAGRSSLLPRRPTPPYFRWLCHYI